MRLILFWFFVLMAIGFRGQIVDQHGMTRNPFPTYQLSDDEKFLAIRLQTDRHGNCEWINAKKHDSHLANNNCTFISTISARSAKVEE